MITNKNMTNEKLVEKYLISVCNLYEKENIRTRDIVRTNDVRMEILNRMDFDKPCECNRCNNLKFISTPTHGYLLVPCTIMDLFPKVKKQITDFSWITDGIWYLEEDADATLFMESTGYINENVEEISSEDDIGLDVMSPHHPAWRTFYGIMCVRLNNHPCDARTLNQAKFVLREFFPEIDLKESIKYFKSHGGFCDCEIMMNVEDSSDNIKIEE